MKSIKRYPRYAKKARIRSRIRYSEKREDISSKIKADRKKTPEKYRLKRQKEIARDPEGFKKKKNANWAKNYPKNKITHQKHNVQKCSCNNKCF